MLRPLSMRLRPAPLFRGNLSLFTFVLPGGHAVGKAGAWDLRDKPFGLRLQIADDRTTNFFPAAHPILSMNPAADDFTREPPFAYNVLG